MQSSIKPIAVSTLNTMLGRKMGIWFSFVGTMIISSTTAFTYSMGIGGGNGKVYPLVVAVHPEWMKLGLGLTVFSFIIQTMEDENLKSKLINVAIFLVCYFGGPLLIGAN